jgi:hypothetical protein
MVSVKGTSIAGRREYVVRHFGEAKLRAVLAQLKDREAAQRLEKAVLKSNWYSFDLFIDLTETIDRVLGFGDGRLIRKISAETAQEDLSGVYKIFFKHDPVHLFRKATQFFGSYYNSSGTLQVTKLADTAFELEVMKFETPHWAHCETIIGWAQRAIELTGMKNVHGDHLECRGRGAQRCRMQISWAG